MDVEWDTDERHSQVWVYSYFIRGLSDIQGIENLTHVLIKLGTGRESSWETAGIVAAALNLHQQLFLNIVQETEKIQEMGQDNWILENVEIELIKWEYKTEYNKKMSNPND